MQIKIIIIINLICISCNDEIIDLGNNYYLRLEGGSTNEIYNTDFNNEGIPPEIMRYDFNKDYIIAEQKPNLHDDVMHDNKIYYKYGREAVYYWIIIKDKNQIIGPCNALDFNEAKKKYKLSDELEFKAVY